MSSLARSSEIVGWALNGFGVYRNRMPVKSVSIYLLRE